MTLQSKWNISLKLNRIKIVLICLRTGNLYHLCQAESGFLGSVSHKAVQFLQDEVDLNFVLQLNVQGDLVEIALVMAFEPTSLSGG